MWSRHETRWGGVISECWFPTFQDDRYFLSGSLDGKLRLWNIPDKKVALWNEIEGVGEVT